MMHSKKLLELLQEIVGKEFVTTDRFATFAYLKDASNFGGTHAAGVVRPGSTEEVALILSLANRQRIPVVIRGGGASIYGQPEGVPGHNLLLDMTRMNNVKEINPRSMTVTAQAGIIMSKLELACRREGFYIFTPFVPNHIVSLGGWMSGVAGSAGLWKDIISMTVVLADGTVVTTGGGPGTNRHQPLAYNRTLGGPDFTGLFTGDGGSFGIKTESTVRIRKYPPLVRAGIMEFATLENVLAMMERHVQRDTSFPFDALLVFGAGAMENFAVGTEDVKAFTVQRMAMGYSSDELDCRLAAFHADAQELGGTSNPALEAMAAAMEASAGTEGDPGMDWMALFNGFGRAAWLPFTLPREGFADVYHQLLAWREERRRAADERGYRCNATWEFFTVIDQSTIIGEMDVFFEETHEPGLQAYARDLMRDFQEYAHRLGSIDVYNQGFMADLNATCWSAGFKALFQTVKTSLDPNNILNPGLWTDLRKDPEG
ncbi:MAG: FAD-binding oxidoreductase [Deltaproteobacteria bacterium]|nr:FAD-binding oxidoreductase [Deltaproteobacteria bacterium]